MTHKVVKKFNRNEKRGKKLKRQKKKQKVSKAITIANNKNWHAKEIYCHAKC